MFTSQTTLIFAALLSASLFSSPAIAADPANPLVVVGYKEPLPSKTVSYADLNLRGAAGQAVLNGRVERAVRSLCGVSMGTIPLEESLEQRRCTRDTLAGAQPQLAAAIERAGVKGTLAAATTAITIAVKR